MTTSHPYAYHLIADLAGSRRLTFAQLTGHRDRLLIALASVPALNQPALTRGDEIHLTVADQPALVHAAQAAARLSGWYIGVGAGPVELLGADGFMTRGDAVRYAEQAVTAAKQLTRTPAISVRGPGTRGLVHTLRRACR